MTKALGDQHRLQPAASTPACVAVIVHWTDAEATLACVAALRSGTVAPSLVVVDNASEDGSGQALAERLRGVADVDVLRAASNGGFGAGCNLGIERALSRHPELAHVALVNPDAVVAPDCVEALLDAARRHPEAGIVGGRVLDPSGTGVLYENGRFRPWTLGRSHAPAPRGRDEFETGFVTGALMLVDGALLRDGLRFDTTYFLYVEDLDFCREVVARGRRLWVTTRATCRHAEGGSQRDDPPLLGPMRARQLEQLTRGKVYFARKRLPWPQRLVFFTLALLLRPVAGVFVARSLRVLGPYFRGVRAGMRAPLRRAR
ncbi:MAG: glycosyltransferase family 2 protein [Planctomycetes bacterium]|nr:glycosyltransferase family 2 protein [Planctomycetota bacterium]